MPANSGGVRTDSGTLTASTVATVTFAARYSYVQITNEGGTTPVPIYFTTDGSTPTVAGNDCDVAYPGDITVMANGQPMWWQGFGGPVGGNIDGIGLNNYTTLDPPQASGPASGTNPGTVIKLISSGTMAYTVEGVG